MRKFKFTMDNGTRLHIHPPTVSQYYDKYFAASEDEEVYSTIAEIVSRNDEGITFTADDISNKFTVVDIIRFIGDFPEWIRKEKESDLNLNVPYYPENGESKAYFRCVSGFKKIAADYSGCSIREVYDMDVFEYWSILHDAVVWNNSGTKEGREYLENAYMYIQERPDRKTARKLLGGKKWQEAK